MIRRRDFITLLGGAAVAWPVGARAQQPARIRRIAILTPFSANDAEGNARLTAFAQGLAQSGWTVGQNVRIDYRWGDGKADTMRKYAAELVALGPDVILASSSAAVAPLLEATRTIPIVFAGIADPVAAGYVENLARPGGNARFSADTLSPKIDVAESKDAIDVTAELPGVDEKDLDVTLANGMLTVRGEKRIERDEQDKDKNWHGMECSYGSFSRTIPLPFDPDPAKVEAKFDNGVLRIHLPKPAEVAQKQQKIEIKKG
jgi:HSP20 family molecular chaperone IbpA